MFFSFYKNRYVPFACIGWLGTLLSGCATVIPPFDIPNDIGNRPTVFSIVTRVKCELNDIVNGSSELERELSLYDDVQVGIELSLSVTDDGGLAPTFSALNGVFTFATGFNIDQSRAQNFTEELQFSLREVSNEHPHCGNPPDTNLSGLLGLKQAYEIAVTSGPNLDWKSKSVFGGSITFTVNKALTATGPTWKLTHFIGPGNFFSASDKNVDKLTFAFVKGKNAGKRLGATMAQETQGVISRIIQNQIATSLITISQSQH